MRVLNPCLSELNETRKHYVLEKDKYTLKCDGDRDHRYSRIMNVSETILFQESGVIEALSALPEYNSSIHEHNDHSLWSRSYLDWNIECEWKSGFDRAKVLKEILSVDNAVNKQLQVKEFAVDKLICVIVFEILNYISLIIFQKLECNTLSM